MALRIRQFGDKELPILAISGDLEGNHIHELQQLLEMAATAKNIAIDLEEVRLVDREVLGFLAECKSKGITLKNCPAYIREWLQTGGYTSHDK